jgi:hypothetical protein
MDTVWGLSSQSKFCFDVGIDDATRRHWEKIANRSFDRA